MGGHQTHDVLVNARLEVAKGIWIAEGERTCNAGHRDASASIRRASIKESFLLTLPQHTNSLTDQGVMERRANE